MNDRRESIQSTRFTSAKQVMSPVRALAPVAKKADKGDIMLVKKSASRLWYEIYMVKKPASRLWYEMMNY